MALVKLQRDGSITMPAELREQLKLKDSDLSGGRRSPTPDQARHRRGIRIVGVREFVDLL
jgi:hypothetical protein